MLDVKHSLQLQGCDAGATYTKYVTALQRQAVLRDDIDRVTAQVTGMEQLLTLALVTLPHNPNTTTITEQMTTAQKKKVEEMV